LAKLGPVDQNHRASPGVSKIKWAQAKIGRLAVGGSLGVGMALTNL
jgi:hypothetical protein